MAATNTNAGSVPNQTYEFQEITEAQLQHAGWTPDALTQGELENAHKIYLCLYAGKTTPDMRLLIMPIDAFNELPGGHGEEELGSALNGALREFKESPTVENLTHIHRFGFAYMKASTCFRDSAREHGYTHSHNVMINIYVKASVTAMAMRMGIVSTQNAIETFSDIKQHSIRLYQHDAKHHPRLFD